MGGAFHSGTGSGRCHFRDAAWDQKLDSTNGSAGLPFLPAGCNSDRFKCVFFRQFNFVSATYDGVLDRETGLVWERSPSGGLGDQSVTEADCDLLTLGGRLGWRLPTAAELASLLDPGVLNPALSLPAGHPFTNVAATSYWTSSPIPPFYEVVEFLGTATGAPGFVGLRTPGNAEGAWCVRGPDSQ